MRSARFLLVATLALMACGDDGPTNVNAGVTFPTLSSAVLSTFCWAGNRTTPSSANGTVSSGDCDANNIDPSYVGYYETWRVRVAAATSVTFSASSSFDNTLTVVRINSITGTTISFTEIAFNDDRATGNLNAQVTVTLQPGIDYFVAVAGYDYTETGTYTLTIN